VLSNGEVIPNSAPLEAAQRQLRRLNRKLARRQGPIALDGSARVPSKGWHQTKRQLGRAHARVANLRRNSLHQLTSALAGTYGTVVVEHLNVAGMLRNRRVARRVADAGFGQLRRQLGYKTTWMGGVLVQADTYFPSSKTCSGCGHVKAKLPLSERTYRCERCGLVVDRDLNAARNLAQLVADIEVVMAEDLEVAVVAGSGPETGNAREADTRPGPAGQSVTNREAGTRQGLGETGAVGA
jgi:putative transposase